METLLGSDLLWWITVIDIPVMSGMFWLIVKYRRDQEGALRHAYDSLDIQCDEVRRRLSDFQLEVIRNYASVADMKESEKRLTSHLLRIEKKLDTTALKAEVLSAQSFTGKESHV